MIILKRPLNKMTLEEADKNYDLLSPEASPTEEELKQTGYALKVLDGEILWMSEDEFNHLFKVVEFEPIIRGIQQELQEYSNSLVDGSIKKNRENPFLRGKIVSHRSILNRILKAFEEN